MNPLMQSLILSHYFEQSRGQLDLIKCILLLRTVSWLEKGMKFAERFKNVKSKYRWCFESRFKRIHWFLTKSICIVGARWLSERDTGRLGGCDPIKIIIKASQARVRPTDAFLLINPATHWDFVSFQILKASQFIAHWPWLVSMWWCEPRRPSDNTHWSHVTSNGALSLVNTGAILSSDWLVIYLSVSQYSHFTAR